jgi:hypothetical protein
MTLAPSHSVTLGSPLSFFTTGLRFDVELVDGDCHSHNDKKGNKYNLVLDPALRAKFATSTVAGFSSSLEKITEASMQFYKPDVGAALQGVLYDEQLFLMRREVAHCMALTATKDAIGKNSVGNGLVVHSEAYGQITERLSYGVALAFLEKALGVQATRFSFITGTGTRADFAAPVMVPWLNKLKLTVLNPTGIRIQLEVKGRATNAGAQDHSHDLILNLAKKCNSAPGDLFVAIMVNIPEDAATANWRPKIQVYDPGEPTELPFNEQVGAVLAQVLFQAHRFGLWRTLKLGLEEPWARYLGRLSAEEEHVRQEAPARSTEIEGRLIQREFNGRQYRGRFFSTDLELLGSPGNRLISEDEAHFRLEREQWRQKWFRGLDIALASIIEAKDPRGLLAYGVADNNIQSPAPFYVSTAPRPDERELTSEEREEAKRAFAWAFDLKRTTGRW